MFMDAKHITLNVLFRHLVGDCSGGAALSKPPIRPARGLALNDSAALSTQPAETIASAAKAFRQDDDVTALTLSYTGVPASV